MMKGRKPELSNVIPMKGDESRSVPAAPDLLSEGGKSVWNRLAPNMVREGRLDPHFEDMFAALCETFHDVIELSSIIAVEGRTYEVKTRNGLQQKKTAAWNSRQDAFANMRQLGAVFGMNPVDDKRLTTSDQGDLFDQLAAQLNAPT